MGRYEEYQKRFFGDFGIMPKHKVLDIGIGNSPFPLATHLADKFTEPNEHNSMIPLKRDKRPFYVVDLEGMSIFQDKEFDFVYCSHVIEHCENPLKACKELMRIGYRGFIETPSKTGEIMFGDKVHKWYTVISKNTIIFDRIKKLQPFGDMFYSFMDTSFGDKRPFFEKIKMDFQRVKNGNPDLFFSMFFWESSFNVEVIE